MLSYRWNKQNNYITNTIVKFVHRAQTSLLQFDEHNHELWFTHNYNLNCLNLNVNRIDYSYGFNLDDILCYKVYNKDLICIANGNKLRIICRQTNDIYPCDVDRNMDGFRGKHNDILALDIYSNDRERYLILNGSRDQKVSSNLKEKYHIFF